MENVNAEIAYLIGVVGVLIYMGIVLKILKSLPPLPSYEEAAENLEHKDTCTHSDVVQGYSISSSFGHHWTGPMYYRLYFAQCRTCGAQEFCNPKPTDTLES